MIGIFLVFLVVGSQAIKIQQDINGVKENLGNAAAAIDKVVENMNEYLEAAT